jgi:transglutaminase-like putative cysteine protease
MTLEGAQTQVVYEDAHMNETHLISFDPDVSAITIHCEGEVDVTDTNGIIGRHSGYMPLWMFLRSTPLTRAGSGLRKLLGEFDAGGSQLDQMHALSDHIAQTVAYAPGETHVGTTVEEAIAAGKGVCQDHAHIFVTAARALGVPARYVSGYLMMEDRIEQDATHAWAEVHVDGIGWIGFDVSNEICPDARYVRVATGLDYSDAAPVSGMRFGNGIEHLTVALEVQAQTATQTQTQAQ